MKKAYDKGMAKITTVLSINIRVVAWRICDEG